MGLPLPIQPRLAGPADRLTVVLPPLGRGSYVLRYKVLATDGHATFGSLDFTAGGH